MLVFKNNEERCVRIYATNGVNTTPRFTVSDGGTYFIYNETTYEIIQALNYSANARQINTALRQSYDLDKLQNLDVLSFIAGSMFSTWYASLHYGLTVIAYNMSTEKVEFLDVDFVPEGNKLTYTIRPMKTEVINVEQPDCFNDDVSGDYDVVNTILTSSYDISKLSTLVLAKMYSSFDDYQPAILTITEDNFSTDKLGAVTTTELDTIIKAIK